MPMGVGRYKDARDADGDLPECIPAEKKREDWKGESKTIIVETREKAPRELYIRKEDAEKTWINERLWQM